MMIFIVNPVAGNGYAELVKKRLQDEMAIRALPYAFWYTSGPGHATVLAAEAAATPDCTAVISVGGDGTSYEVACGLIGTKIPLGIIPAGTGNDFIKSTGTPKDPIAALEYILSTKPRPVDVGSINDRLFLNVSGTGFDVTVLDYTLAAKKYMRGIFPYLVGLVRAVAHNKKVHLRLTVDGKTEEKDVLLCTVANGRFIGGGIPICPVAQVDDGKLDVVVADVVPRWKILYYLPGLLMGRILGFGITRHRLCDCAVLECPGMRVNVDGEIFSMDKAEFRVQPDSLMLYW